MTDEATDNNIDHGQVVGICLSGGGVRAAAFSLGALQSFHEHAGLLRGDRSARWISAVSGGSYIAGTLTLLNAGSRARYSDDTTVGGHDFSTNESPLAQGSPEVAHILNHCRYMVDDGGVRTVGKLLLLIVASFVTITAAILWLGVMVIGDAGMIGLLIHRWMPPPTFGVLAEWGIGLGGLLLLPMMGRKRNLWWGLLTFPMAVILCWTMPFLARRLEATPLLRSPQWLLEHFFEVLSVTAIFLVFVGALNISGRWRPLSSLSGVGRALIHLVVSVTPWIIAVLLICWVGTHAFTNYVIPLLNDTADIATLTLGLGLFLGILFLAVLIIPLPGLISPHRPYRDLVSRCFAVRKPSAGCAEAVLRPDHVTLSSLVPATNAPRYPELLICAAANISDRGATPAGSNVLPLVISGQTLSIPTHQEAVIRTSDLESMQSPHRGYGLVRPAPSISLSAAVAIAGAALSPSMGRMSRPSLRPLLAALNIRLGVWLPNPLSESAREHVGERDSTKFGVTIDQLIWEFFGHHSAKSNLLYASDGGHYENLGMLELLRRRCKVIYAVDASDDAPGRASTLVQCILLAEAELGCRIDIDVAAFAIRDGHSRPASSHATGTIQYPDGTTGSLHVLKLGVTDRHSSILKEYEAQDPGFPFHATMHQIYSAERFEAYRRLGAEGAELLMDSP